MDEKLSKDIALRFLNAMSAKEVKEILQDPDASYYFDAPENWQPYGGRDKNWDTVGNQQSNPVGALVELIINGMDSILLKKARESGITDFRADDAPHSMFEAVKRFFPSVVEGKITMLESKQRTALAEQCVLIGVKRADRKNSRYPTYTLVDFGEGQKPEDFPKTFLSLGEKNKEGIPFVQGKFNMGSTGSLRFCTRSEIRDGHYKFILSRRYGQPYWGWTLIRVRLPRPGESLPVAEYFAPGKAVPRFREEEIRPFGSTPDGMVGTVREGSIVKLFEYDIGGRAHNVDLGIANALTVNLIDCALPVRIYDFDAEPADKGGLRLAGIAARTFAGMNVELHGDEVKGDTEWTHLVVDENHEELGNVKVIATGLSKLTSSLKDQPARIFYTVNGQTHAFERASFLNTRVGLGDLRNHLLVNVICDEMDRGALAAIFMPDRERKANVNLARTLEDLVIKNMKADDRLRAYAAEIRRRRATEYVEDENETKDFLEELVKLDPAIKDLFGLGVFFPETAQSKGGEIPFKGKKFPTFLTPLNLREEDGLFVKEVPVNTTRRIECATDADDDYLTRLNSPGWKYCSLPAHKMPYSVKLRNGTATFTVTPPKTAVPGDIVEVEFGVQDNGPNIEPLMFKVAIKYVEEEKPKEGKPGKLKETEEKNRPALAIPQFPWVTEAEWADHSFDEESGAYVDTGEHTCVYINRDNKYLRAMRLREKDEAATILNENMFRYGLGILALAIHKKASTPSDQESETDPEQIVRLTTSAMAPHIITIIKRLGGTEAS